MSQLKTLTDQIADSLARRIMQGHWPVGSKMPPETELMLRYGCARVTIRRALAKLEKAGMISRRPKIGTTVLSKGPGVSFAYSLSELTDINQLGFVHHRQILKTDTFVADSAFASKFSTSIGERFLRLHDLRLGLDRHDPPIVFTYVYIPERYQGILMKAQSQPERLVISLIEEFTGKTLHEVTQHVYAEPMPQDIASLLTTEAGSPALRIIRQYYDIHSSRLLLSDSWHPGNRYAFHIPIIRQAKPL